jgi:FAD/FMN-containing dehydrogenases
LSDRPNYQAILSDLQGIEVIDQPHQIAKLSLDYFHFSPVLAPLLQDKRADLVVRPRNPEEIQRVCSICAREQIPLTVRGAGTGNYGQCIPLAGGIVLDMTQMSQIKEIANGIAKVEAGAKLWQIEKQAREQGWELRMFPSTIKTATIGGFIAGGSGGIGSLRYGQLRDRGNLRSATVISLEVEPQTIELRGSAVQQINHAYGTNGVITELEIPLAPAVDWAEAIAIFPDFMTCARFGQTLGNSDGILCRMISVHSHPIPQYFTALKNHLPHSCHCALVLIAASDLEPFTELVGEFGGTVTYQKPALEAQKGISLVEFSWNHTTLHARSSDPQITYLQSLFVNDPQLSLVQHMAETFADELFTHLEFIRMQGQVIPAGIQLVKYRTAQRLQEIIDYHEAHGVLIANPHTYILEDGGMKTINHEQLAFKRRVDPHNLMNVGKMKFAATPS